MGYFDHFAPGIMYIVRLLSQVDPREGQILHGFPVGSTRGYGIQSEDWLVEVYPPL